MTLHFWSSVFNFISKQCKSSIQRHFEHDKYAARITVLSNTLGNNSTSTAIHCVSKKGATFIFAITLANVHRF